MIYASTNVIYCTNKQCVNKCWRYANKYKFNDDEYYWYKDKCSNYRLRVMKAKRNTLMEDKDVL